MRWYEYKMETDDLYAPDDLKAKLLAMTDQLTEEEKAQPMMKTAAPVPAQSAPVQPKKKLIRFPAKRVGALAACLAVCVVGYGAFATGQIGLGAKSSSPAVYYSADSTAAAMAAGGADRAAVDSALGLPETAKVDQAASLVHMMNQNTFTAAAYHCTDDADALATALRDNIQQRQWMCGFPDKVAVAVVGEYVVSVFGAEDLVDTFMSHLNGIFGVQPVYDEAIL